MKDKKRKNIEMEQVLYLQEATKFMENGSTSFASTVIENIKMNEHTIKKQCSVRCYQPRHLNFNSAEEENIMEWVHLEPPMHHRASTPLPSNKNTTKNNTKNTKSNTHTENNRKIIRKLYIKIQSL